VILYVLNEKLVQAFFLHTVKHYLVDALTEKCFAEPAFDISRVYFVQYFYVVIGF